MVDTYHKTDIGNVNNVTVTYLEKQKHAEYFPVCYPAAFWIFEVLKTGLCNVDISFLVTAWYELILF